MGIGAGLYIIIIIIITLKRWCLGWHYHAQNVAGPPNKH